MTIKFVTVGFKMFFLCPTLLVYASGAIEEVGQSVTEFTPGDRIFGMIRGAYAEYGVAKAQELIKMPENLTFEDAATIKAGAEAAWIPQFTYRLLSHQFVS